MPAGFKRYILIGLMLWGWMAGSMWAQPNTSALPWRMATAYHNYLLREMQEQYDLRELELEKALSSAEDMQAYLELKNKAYRELLGEFPTETGLDARIVARVETKFFVLENIIFQSMPGRFVTANLYLPLGNGPFPVALELCGHGLSGKISQGQLRQGQLFTANGMALMVVDPIGQGERIQFLDEEGNTRTRGATTEHTLLNAGANLLGTSLAALEYWDNHRALDYLVTRNDIRPDAMGVFGSSGGGTQTAYMVGLDERIRVASVCSYFTRREKVLEIYGPSDGCQHIPYEGREGLEIADFIMMMAPAPVLIMSGKYDFVDYHGAVKSFEELKRVYTVLGAPGKVDMFSMEGGHGMPEPKKHALVNWFRYWLRGDSLSVFPEERIALSTDKLQCSPSGQVLSSFPEAVSVQDYHLQKALELEETRRGFLQGGRQELRVKVEELLGYDRSEAALLPEMTGSFSMRAFDVRKYQLVREGELPLPCLLLLPETLSPESEVVVLLHEGGKEEVFNDETTLDFYMNESHVLLLADLRGFGETADPLSLNNSKYWNREYRNAMTAMHLGKPIMGQRVTDIVSLLDFLEQDPVTSGLDVRLVANGRYGPAALHAAFLDQRISRTEISRSIKSFLEFLEHPMQRDVYSNVLYGVLQYYDLDDLHDLIGRDRVRFVD